MGQAINSPKAERETTVFVSEKANDVLTKQDVFEVYCQHASGEGDDKEIQRAIRTSDMAQYIQVRSIHETNAGVRVVVVSEFTLGTTTIDLESSNTPDPGFTHC